MSRILFVFLLLLAAVIPCRAQPAPDAYGTYPAYTFSGNPYPYAHVPVASQGMIAPSNVARWIAYGKAVAMNSTSDQALIMIGVPASYRVLGVTVTNCAATPSGAVGGVYTTTGKGGTPIVAASQTYTALTTASMIQDLTLNSGISTTAQTSSQLYLSLTTGGPATTCDVYVQGSGLP